jgi:thiosulfate reductase cytochrome b subunit
MGIFGAIWGLTGVFLLLASAVYRLSVIALSAFSHIFFWQHWIVLLCSVIFMAYAEGYRAFQQRFSPRVAARAKYLRDHPNMLHVLLAPLFCMGFFHATRRRKITSFSVTAGIVVLIVLVRLLPQPWRGIIDLSVVIGLGWGIFSLAFFGFRALVSEDFDYPPDVPNDG